ncbi:MAG: metallopeptidase family protein [Alphaproteobacteria bacterium]
MNSRAKTAPSTDDLETMAEEALATIPESLRRHVRNLVIRVEDFPDGETAEEMDLETEFDLLGLYRGVDLAHKGVNDAGAVPDMVFLYRRPILDYWCDSGEDLFHVVRHVLIHEIGHHFGLSDDDMEALEAQVPE